MKNNTYTKEYIFEVGRIVGDSTNFFPTSFIVEFNLDHGIGITETGKFTEVLVLTKDDLEDILRQLNSKTGKLLYGSNK